MRHAIIFAKKRAAATLLITAFLTAALLQPALPFQASAKASGADRKIDYRAEHSTTRSRIARLPLSFEENRGQVDNKFKFISRFDRYSLFLTATESLMMVAGDGRALTAALKMKFVGADASARVTGIEGLHGKSNYLIGNDPKKWRTNINTYSKVKCEQVYKGIDVVYYGNRRQLEYDLIVAPGADFKQARISFAGAKSVRTDSRGDLVLETETGEIRQASPVAYQEIGGGRKPVAARYVIASNREVGFSVAGYDASLPLIIDPVLSYSSFLGGDGLDTGADIALDSSGNIYVAGTTTSTTFPVTPGAAKTVLVGFGGDAFITKLNPAGTDVIYSTYLGGNFSDGSFGGSDGFNQRQGGLSIAVDEAGNAFVTGATFSTNFPVTVGAFQRTSDEATGNCFITRLSLTGDALIYSTYLGGADRDFPTDIAVDRGSNVYVTGNTYSRDFPTANALQPAHSNDECSGGDFLFQCSDAFVTKLNPQGSALVYSTYLGGNKYDAANGIAVDGTGSAYIVGLTGSSNFPTTPGAFQSRFNGGSFVFVSQPGNAGDAFVSRLSPSGSALVYSTYLGGKRDDTALGIAIDSSGNAYVTGKTDSIDFPVTEGAFQALNAGSGAYRSQDAGGNWNAIENGLSVGEVSALAIDPQTPSTIYAASNATSFPDDRSAKIFKSTDAGASWNRVFSEQVGLTGGVSRIGALAVDPKASNIVYAGAWDRVYKSTDGGGQWVSVGGTLPFPHISINTIAIEAKNTDRFYIGTGNNEAPLPPFGGGIFSTTNGGATLEPSKINIPFQSSVIVFSLAIDPKAPKKLYAATNSGLLQSSNRGKKWKETDLTVSTIAVAVDPRTTSTIYAAGGESLGFGDKIYKSTNGGQSWTQLDTGFTNLSITSLALNPQNPATIYAGLRRFDSLQSGILRSTDGGAHWSAVGLSDVLINALVVDPQTPANIFAAAVGDEDIFVTKLNEEGSALIYSTYLGGRGKDVGNAIAVDGSDRAVVTGETVSANFPLLDAFQSAKFGGPSNPDALVVMLNASGKGLVYSSYLGGAESDIGLAIAIDAMGAAYLTGENRFDKFPVFIAVSKIIRRRLY